MEGNQSVCSSQGSPEKEQSRRDLLIACLTDDKELTHMITEAGKSQDLQGESPAAPFTGWSLETWDPGELRVPFRSEVQPASGPERAKVSFESEAGRKPVSPVWRKAGRRNSPD